MNQELITENESRVAKLTAQDAAIDKLQQKYGELTVSSPQDMEGMKTVHGARMVVRTLRVALEKTRKDLKQDALDFGRMVDAEAKRLFAKIEPLESHLKAQEDIVLEEQARVEREAQEVKDAEARERMAQLSAVGDHRSMNEVSIFTPERFAAELEKSSFVFNEKRRQEDEERARIQKERDEMEAQRQELERVRKEQEAAQAAIDAETKRLAALEADRLNKLHEAQRAKEAEAEKVRIEAEAAQQAILKERQRAHQEAEDARIEAERLKAEAEAEEAAKPYKAKLRALASTILKLENPEGKHSQLVNAVLEKAAGDILAIARKR